MQQEIVVRPYTAADLPAMVRIWNRVVEDGEAFPQLEGLSEGQAAAFFAAQDHAAVAVHTPSGQIVGLYTLHPNNVGRCGHIGNASYAVAPAWRGRHIGYQLVTDSIRAARQCGFKLMQFNAVVHANVHARHLYERCGFKPLGVIPGGFCMKDGHYEDIHLYYMQL